MKPDQLALIHASAFAQERGWSSDEFAALLAQPYIAIIAAESTGFALTRTLAGESELLTLAVHPNWQRRGIARRLVAAWLAAARLEAQTAFLEVAADNSPALGLYCHAGFTRSGLRKGYYARTNASAVDALLMTRALTRG